MRPLPEWGIFGEMGQPSPWSLILIGVLGQAASWNVVSWTMPAYGVLAGTVMLQGLVVVVQQLSSRGGLFLLPALAPVGCPLAKATGFSGRTMASSSFGQVMLHLFSMAPESWPVRGHAADRSDGAAFPSAAGPSCAEVC